MAALDLFVLSSRHEGFGRVVAEAMAAGRPMVVSDEGAPPELVEAERYGLCARPGDAADFARQHRTPARRSPAAAAAMARAAASAPRLFEPRAAARASGALRRAARRGSDGQRTAAPSARSAASANSFRPTSSPDRCRSISAAMARGLKPSIAHQRALS